MFDLKTIQSALSQLEEERGVPRDKVFEAIEMALAAAYKKEYGKKGQIVRTKFDPASGKADFWQVRLVVDETMLKEPNEGMEEEGVESKKSDGRLRTGSWHKSDLFETPMGKVGLSGSRTSPATESAEIPEDTRVYFNEEHHIMIEDARKIRRDVQVGDELTFPLEPKDDFGRIAAQTAKQVIIQRIREAEKVSVLHDYGKRQGEIVSGRVQMMDRGNVLIDLGRTVGMLPREEQIPGEFYRQGERIKAYLYLVDETPRGVTLKLSRSHPQLLAKLFEVEAPEIAAGTVVLKAIAREAGSRSKIAVASTDASIDPIGACVGQRGVRVSTIINELGGEKIDILEWSDKPETLITNALSPARVDRVELNLEAHTAKVVVDENQFSLAIGKGGQNVRLAAKLTGWKIDIHSSTEKPPEPAVSIEPASEESGGATE